MDSVDHYYNRYILKQLFYCSTFDATKSLVKRPQRIPVRIFRSMIYASFFLPHSADTRNLRNICQAW